MTTTTEERVARVEGELGHLATKADIGDVRTEMAGLRTEMAGLRTDIAKLSATLTWRMIIVAGVVQTLIAAAVKYLP